MIMLEGSERAPEARSPFWVKGWGSAPVDLGDSLEDRGVIEDLFFIDTPSNQGGGALEVDLVGGGRRSTRRCGGGRRR